MLNNTVIKDLGVTNYADVLSLMQDFTKSRNEMSCDEVWVTQHNSVYTQGLAGLPCHILQANKIPIIQSDRGGQITYHGLGQLVVYVLIDLRRKSYGVKDLVKLLEQSIISYLLLHGVVGEVKDGAPGVYVASAKIASIGLRVSRGCSFHGIAFNVDMDLSPFSDINPCGYQGLAMANLKDFVNNLDFSLVSKEVVACVVNNL